MKRGRRKGKTALSGIRPDKESWTDIRNRIIYDSPDWRIVRLRQLIGDGSKLADNFLTTIRLGAVTQPEVSLQDWNQLPNNLLAKREGNPREEWLAARDKLYKSRTGRPYKSSQEERGLAGEIASLWAELSAQIERAVLDGDANWFTDQAKALGSVQQQRKAPFNAKVVYLLEMAMWGMRAKQGRTTTRLQSMPNHRMIKQRKADQAILTSKQRKAWIRERDSAARAYERYLNTPEGRAESDHKKRLTNFYAKYPQHRPCELSRAEQAEQNEKQREIAASLKKQRRRRRRSSVLEASTVTPAGICSDAAATDIYNALNVRPLSKDDPGGPLIVEGCPFEKPSRVMDAIHALARQLRFALRKQVRKRKTVRERIAATKRPSPR